MFFTRAKDQTPPVLAWHVRHNRALHQNVLTLTMTVLFIPLVDPVERLTLKREADHFWRGDLHQVGPIRRVKEISVRLHSMTGIDPGDSVK